MGWKQLHFRIFLVLLVMGWKLTDVVVIGQENKKNEPVLMDFCHHSILYPYCFSGWGVVVECGLSLLVYLS